MNKHLYRVIFNRSLGVFQVVSELVRRPGRGVSSQEGTDCASQRDDVMAVTVRPVSLGLWVAFGWIGLAPLAFAGQIVTDPNAPGNQRPTVLGAPGGAPLINIQTPSAAGVSRNTYRQFDVDTNGAVLNNSRTKTQSQLAGAIGGNPWLATGTAKVILNEVTGSNPSQLNGYVEVAGDRAQVVIANPAGIACDGCGFINANRVTLTTGAPVLAGGALDGYRVTGGAIQVTGKGLDASRTDYTDLIARSMAINAGIWAPQLQVITGANQVDADHTQVTAVAGEGATPVFALDVSALGGMYAGKIQLLGTEHGVGVRHAGTIGAQAGELTVTVDGRLENTGSLQSQADTSISASGGVANSGTISATRTLSVATPRDVDNTGGVLNAARLVIGADSLRNQGGTITQTGLQGIALQTGALSNQGGTIGAPDPAPVDNGSGSAFAGGDGAGSTNGNAAGRGTGEAAPGTSPGTAPPADGVLRIAGLLDNDGGTIHATRGFDLTSASGLSNDEGRLTLRHLGLTGGNLSNRGGVLAIDGMASIQAHDVINDAGQLSFADTLSFNVQRLSNRGGTFSHAGTAPTALSVAGTLDNTDGTLASNASALALTSGTLINEGGTISHAGPDGLTVTTNALYGAGGKIATAGAVQLTAGAVDHQRAMLTATQVSVSAASFDNRGGTMTASGDDANTLQVTGAFDNSDGGTIESNADLSLQAGTLGNANGTIQHAGAGTLHIDATTFNGAGGTIGSNGDLVLAGTTTDLGGGNTSAQTMSITTSVLSTARGTLVAAGNDALKLVVSGAYDNTGGQVSTNGALQLSASSLANTNGSLVAAGTDATNLAVTNRLDNTGGAIAAAGATTVHAHDLINQGGTLQASGAPLSVTADGLLDNSIKGLVASDGDLNVRAATFDNTQGTVQHAGQGTARITATTLQGQGGTIASNGALQLQGGALNLRQGTTEAHAITVNADALTTAGGTLQALGGDPLDLTVRGLFDNTAGIVATNGALQLGAQALTNTDGKLSAAGSEATNVTVAGRFDNTGGTLAAMGATTVTGGDIVNRGGAIQAAGSPLTVTANDLLDNSQRGKLTSDGGLTLRAATLDNTQGAISHSGTSFASQHAGQGAATISAATLNGQRGTIESNGQLSMHGGKLDLRYGTTYAQRVTVDADALTTAGGTLQALGGDALNLNVRGLLDNTGGQIATNGALLLAAQALANANGGLQAAGTDATVLTVTQAFDNSHGTLATMGATTLHAGSLDNTAGALEAGSSVPLTVAIDGMWTNDHGSLVGNGALALTAGSLGNHGGIIQTQQSIDLTVTGTLDNSEAGTVIAGEDLTLQAAVLLNRDTLNTSAPQGLYGDHVQLRADTIDNTRGQIHADHTLAVQGRPTSGSAITNAGGSIDGTGAVTIAATTFDNTSGQLIQRGSDGSLSLNATQALTNTSGGRIGAEGAASIHAGSIDNSGGNTSAQSDLYLASDADLVNRQRGMLQALGALRLIATGAFDNSGGQLDATGAATIHAASVSNVGGQMLAGDKANPEAALQIVSGSILDNRSGMIGNRGGDLTLNAANIDNSSNGNLVAQRDLTFDSVGTHNNNGGLTYATRNLSFQNSGATLDNTGGTFGAGGTAWITLAKLTNNAGAKLQADALWLATPELANDRGDIGANSLHATLISLQGLGTLHGADLLDLHFLGDYTHLAGQQFQSDGTLSLKVDGILTNQGSLQTQGELDVAATHLVNQGTINASNMDGTARATLTALGQIDNQAGAAIEADTLTLDTTDVTNASSKGITGDVVRIHADTLTNGRDLGTADAAIAYDEGFIGAAQTLDLRIAQRLANLDGELYSGGDLTIAGRADASRVATLDNVSGRIQAEGDGSIAADVITNRKRFIETVQVALSADEQYALSSERQYDNALAPAEQQRMAQLFAINDQYRTAAEDAELLGYLYRIGWVHADHVNDADLAILNATYNQIAIDKYGQRGGYLVVGVNGNPGAEFKQTDTYLTGTRVTRESADSQILIGSNLSIDLGTHLTNFASTIAATGDLTISGQAYDGSPDARIDNLAVAGQYTVQRDLDALVLTPVPVKYLNTSGNWKSDMADFSAHISTDTVTVAGPILAAATITGRNVSISGHDITNTAVAASGGLMTLSGGDLAGPGSTTLSDSTEARAGHAGAISSAQGDAVHGAGNANRAQGSTVAGTGTVSGSGAQSVGSADTPLPGYVPPSNGKFSQNTDPSAPFLVTMAPRFAKGASTSSDYLLRALGDDPSNVHKRLGDGYYEQNLVLDQLLQLTGRRTLNGGDGLAQYQALMDGAASEASRLGLQLGAPLTTQQIASLSTDIVWLVDQVVDGQHVLVPVVYLSQSTADRMKHDGALIAGDTVNVAASGTVRNDGTMTGTQGMTLNADTLINTGAMKSDGALAIATRNETINTGGMKANAIGIVAGGNVVNAPAIDGLLAKGGTITAGTSGVQIVAANDVINQGKITSAGDAAIVAGRDYVQSAATSGNGTHAPAGDLTATGSAVVIAGRDAVFDQSTLSAGKVAYIDAGRDAHFTAATVNGGTGVGVVAGQDIVSDTVTDHSASAQFSKQGKNWSSSSTTDETVRGSTFQSGGDVTMQAGRDISLTAATVKADGAVGVSAGRDVNLFAGENTHTETADSYSKHGKTKTTTHSEVNDTTMVGTTIRGKQGVVMSAGQDLNTVAATITSSDGAVVMHADRDINLMAGQNTHSEDADSKTTKKGFFNKKETTTHNAMTDTTAVGTTVSGKNGIALDAGRNVLGVGTTLESSAGGIAVTAGDQVAFLAAQDTRSTEHSEKVRRSGVEWVPNPKQGTQKKTTTTEQVSAVGNTLDAKGPIVVASGGDQAWQAANIKSDTGTALVSGGAINFVTVTNSDTYQRDSGKHNVAYQAQDHRLRVDTTEVQTSISGPVSMAAADGITIGVGQKQGETQDQAIARASQQSHGTAWIADLQGQNNVSFQSVDEQHIDEHQHHEGLTPAAGAVVTIAAAYFTAGAASTWIGSASGSVAGSGTAMAAGTSASATSAAVSAGWANATLSGLAAGSISSGVGAAAQGYDWRTPALYGGITGAFAGYLSGGTYYDNPVNSVKDTGRYIASGNWEALGNVGLNIATTQAAGRVEVKVANELGMNGEQLNWLLMAASIVGNELNNVGTRYKTVTDSAPLGEKDFVSTGGTGMRGYANRGTVGLLFDTVDVVLGYQGLPDASVASAAYNQDANGINQPRPQNLTCHSLGTVTCSYLARNGLAQGDIYLASVPFGVVAPPNATTFLGNGDAVNGFYGGKMFNWNGIVVPIQLITGHPYENYKQYVDAAAAEKNK